MSTLLTHLEMPPALEEKQRALKEKIEKRGNLPHVTVAKQLALLEELATFPLGAFLICNGGLNGFWTDYILFHPERGRVTGRDATGHPFSEMEAFLLDHAPLVLATQERFQIFKQQLQKRLREGVTMASIPCGLMSDLFTLQCTSLTNYSFIGVDLDPAALQKARLSIPPEKKNHILFYEGDAWSFLLPQKADVITSNGLNIYEPNRERVVALYRHFFHNLKPGGTLITSFLTPPPPLTSTPEWLFSQIDPAHALLQRILLADVLSLACQAYTSSAEVTEQLQEAGFVGIEIIPDKARLFPTVVAYRPA